MEKDNPLATDLILRNIEIINNNSSTKRSSRAPNSNRTLIKLHLTRSILEECLETLDIFKQIMEDPAQKTKLIRDVNKNIQLKLYDEEAIIYDKGDVAECIYMVIKGTVSLCLPVYKQNEVAEENSHIQYEYQQIDCFEDGVGFGEADFIQNKKRSLVAKVKKDNTVIGIIAGSAFESIIENYRQRVYYKKIEMFSKCPLLCNLHKVQLQFIVNNAKPIIFPISKEVIELGQKSKALYLITQGQIQLRRVHKKNQSDVNQHRSNTKIPIQTANIKDKIKIKNMVVGVLQQGQFLGDCQLALDIPFNFSAVTKSERVRAYICDERIIMSQMTEQSFEYVAKHYEEKRKYRKNKEQIYRNVKSKIQKSMQTNDVQTLSKNQIKIRRMITNRYVQKVPTLIGQLSPKQIGLIVDKKYARIKSQPSYEHKPSSYFPSINIIPQNKKIKIDQSRYSPLLKKSQQKLSKKHQFYSEQLKQNQSISYNTPQIRPYIYNEGDFLRSQTRPLLMIMRPFHKKVQSLHQRLCKQYNNSIIKKRSKMDQMQQHFSIVEMRRVYEFINKIKCQNRRKCKKSEYSFQ